MPPWPAMGCKRTGSKVRSLRKSETLSGSKLLFCWRSAELSETKDMVAGILKGSDRVVKGFGNKRDVDGLDGKISSSTSQQSHDFLISVLAATQYFHFPRAISI